MTVTIRADEIRNLRVPAVGLLSGVKYVGRAVWYRSAWSGLPARFVEGWAVNDLPNSTALVTFTPAVSSWIQRDFVVNLPDLSLPVADLQVRDWLIRWSREQRDPVTEERLDLSNFRDDPEQSTHEITPEETSTVLLYLSVLRMLGGMPPVVALYGPWYPDPRSPDFPPRRDRRVGPSSWSSVVGSWKPGDRTAQCAESDEYFRANDIALIDLDPSGHAVVTCVVP